MAKRKQQFNPDVTKKLEALRREVGLTLAQAAEHFGYKRGDTIREWEQAISKCPTTKRHEFITYLLNKLGLGKDEPGIQVFLQLWDKLVVLEWDEETLSLGELEIYLPDKVNILARLLEALTGRPPLQRPETVRHFTGREKELKLLLETLQPGQVVVVRGPGGMGKSALVAEAIHALIQDNHPPELFPDGIITHNFYEDRYASNALLHIARSFKVNIDPGTSPAMAARLALSGRQALFILEGCENADDLDRVLAERNQCGVLITTRKREHAVLGTLQIDLNPFNTADGVDLLKKWAEAQLDHQEAVEQICELVGGLPLAIRLAGSYMVWRNEVATRYLNWLKETPLEALDHGERRLQSVPILLEKSVAQVSKTARQVLEVVGVLALAPFDQTVMAEALALSASRIRRPLDELINYSLLDPIQNRYKVSHTLIHTYAKQQMLASDEIVERLTAYYLTLTKALSDQGPEGYSGLDFERTHVLAILARCTQQKDWEMVQNLAWTIDDYLDLQGHWTDRETVLKAGLEAARSVVDPHDEAEYLSYLGITYHDLGQMEQAIECYSQALAIVREIGNRKDEGANLNSLGNAYNNLGQVPRAVSYYEQALVIAREVGDQQGEGNALGNLGNAYSSLGQMARAISYYEQALAMAREIGNREGEEVNLNNLGLAYSDVGEMEKAISYYEQALAMAQEVGNRRGESNSLGNLGLAYSSLGQMPRAISYYEQALAVARKIGDQRGEGNHLGNLGLAYSSLGQVPRAISYYEQALAIARKIDDRQSEGSDLGNLGNAYNNLGQMERAVEYYQQALAIAQEIGDRHNEGNHLANLGSAYYDLGQIEEAIEYYEQALVIAREIGYRRGQVFDLGNLGNAYCDLGYVAQAIEYFEQGLAIALEIGDRQGEGNHLANLGLAYRDLGQLERAIGYYEQALTIVREIGDRHGEGSCLGGMGNAYRALRQIERAITHYEQALAIAREIGDRRGEGNRLVNLGLAYQDLGQVQNAINLYQQAIPILEEIRSPDAVLIRDKLNELLR